jgi:hypothetical protein
MERKSLWDVLMTYAEKGAGWAYRGIGTGDGDRKYRPGVAKL